MYIVLDTFLIAAIKRLMFYSYKYFWRALKKSCICLQYWVLLGVTTRKEKSNFVIAFSCNGWKYRGKVKSDWHEKATKPCPTIQIHCLSCMKKPSVCFMLWDLEFSRCLILQWGSLIKEQKPGGAGLPLCSCTGRVRRENYSKKRFSVLI